MTKIYQNNEFLKELDIPITAIVHLTIDDGMSDDVVVFSFKQNLDSDLVEPWDSPIDKIKTVYIDVYQHMCRTYRTYRVFSATQIHYIKCNSDIAYDLKEFWSALSDEVVKYKRQMNVLR